MANRLTLWKSIAGLFGRRTQKVASTERGWTTVWADGPVALEGDDLRTPEQAYQVVSWLQVAITTIAEQVQLAPLLIYQSNPRQLVEAGIDPHRLGWVRQVALVENKALADSLRPAADPLELLTDPLRDGSMTWSDLIEQITGWWHLRGRVCLWCPQSAAGTGPLFIKPLPPMFVRAIADSAGRLTHYEYRHRGGTELIPQTEMVEMLRWHPQSGLLGLSPFEAIMHSANADLHQVRWNENQARYGMRRDGFLVTDADLTSDDRESLSETFTARYGGAANAHRIPVLSSGVRWQNVGLSPREAEWLAARKFTAREIGAIFRVPPIFMGDYDLSHYNITEQRRILWRNAVLPFLRRVKLMFDRQLLLSWGKGYYCDWDISGVEELGPELEKAAATDEIYLRNRVLAPGEVRRRTFGLPAYRGSMTIYGNPAEVPLATADDIEPAEAVTPVGVVKAGKFANRHIVTASKTDEPVVLYKGRPARLEVPNHRAALRRYYRQHQELLRPQLDRLGRLCRAHTERIIKRADALLADGVTNIAGHLSLTELADELEERALPLVRSFCRTWGNLALAVGEEQEPARAAGDTEAKGGRRFDIEAFEERVLAALVEDWARTTTDVRVREAQETIDQILTEGLRAREDHNAIAARLREVLGTEYRGEMASRTLLTGASEAARDEGWRQSGRVQATKWLPAWPDGRNRSWHLAMESVDPVPLGTPFILTHPDGRQVQALYPGDPALPLEDRINCRCTRLAVLVPAGE